MWWMLFWQANKPLGADVADPVLDAWNRAWFEILRSRDGPVIKKALDALAPKSNVVEARKPS